MSAFTLTLIGGPTVLLEAAGLRLLTDPTFDPAGTRYAQGPVRFTKTAGPALLPEQLGPVDVVLLSHDEHLDNLDAAGRALLPQAGLVLTTPSGAKRLGGNARGLTPWERVQVGEVAVTAVPARHGPEGSERFLGEVTGFVVEAGGEALYVSGDTRAFAPLSEVGRRFRIGTAVVHAGDAHFAEVPVDRLTPDAREAAEVFRAVGAETLVPVHVDGWAHVREGREALGRALAAEGLDGALLCPTPGERTPLRARRP